MSASLIAMMKHDGTHRRHSQTGSSRLSRSPKARQRNFAFACGRANGVTAYLRLRDFW